MSNSPLTIDTIATAAVAILDNELVMAKQVYRGLESEFTSKINGYEIGDTVSMRRPTDFTVRDGAIAVNQDVVEGKVALTVDKQKGVDFGFTSKELTLSISELSERVIKPAMVQLANQIDRDVMGLYKYVPNYVGTPGQTVNSYADFAKAPERMDEYAVPSDRAAVLSPSDHWGLLGSQTALYIQDAAKGAYRNGSLGMIGGVDTYMSQNVPTHTTGSDVTGTVGASITSSTVTYASVKNSLEQTITTANVSLNPGDVIEIEDVYAVNPVTKAALPFKKQFTVISYSSNSAVIYPAMIWDGPFQNVSVTSGVTDLNTKAITSPQTAGGAYRQNLVFHKNAFTLAIVPLIEPPGAVQVSRKSYKGTSVRLIPTYDGTNDRSNFRLDVLYGVKAIDPRLATRLAGTP
jgi:ribosomal 50S subunit-recycling heat shock protein